MLFQDSHPVWTLTESTDAQGVDLCRISGFLGCNIYEYFEFRFDLQHMVEDCLFDDVRADAQILSLYTTRQVVLDTPGHCDPSKSEEISNSVTPYI